MNFAPVIIVGAGPAGLGAACALRAEGVRDVVVLERDEIGASFRRWPRETRFITPSFPARGFGVRDLNSISDEIDPGHRGIEHPSGMEYASYLEDVARVHRLTVLTGKDVRQVDSLPDGCFLLRAADDDWRCATLIWAAGEFRYPKTNPFPGAEHAVHGMTLESYESLKGPSFIVIGGFESGVDVACHLVSRCAHVRVIDPRSWIDEESLDPSCALSPVSRQRLRAALDTGRLEWTLGRVVAVEKCSDGYIVQLEDGRRFASPRAPILATGFEGGLGLVRHLLEFDANGRVRLTDHDESTKTPGLFVTGPMVRHDGQQLCFIYKFRTRHAVLAQTLAARYRGEGSHVRLVG